MANKYQRRRRSLKGLQVQGESRYAATRPLPTDGRAAQPQDLDASGHRAGRGVVIVICCLLVLGTIAVFVQTWQHGFVNCDDNEYVYDNSYIQRGLTPASAWWAITQAHSANWHPLTWMSHIVDWQVFGTWSSNRQRYVDSWPGGHHLVNVLLHAINAVLLFLVFQELTGLTWPSAFVAALFAIHPLRVESVAWITERKDLLSGLFFFLTLAAYRAYAVRPFFWWRYGMVAVTFVLGLSAKSMLVTLPLVLLLLDFWPLRRIASPPTGKATGSRFFQWLPPRVIVEKLPLLALSAGSCALTIWAQQLVAAFKPLDFQYRVGNAIISYAAYIGQMLYPAGMVVQYVHAGMGLQMSDTLIPLATLIAISLAVGWFGWRRRYLAVGWLWYLGMLVPVIGLVQVGAQARADRYTYLTQIGLYIMVAWGLRDLARAWRDRTILYAALAAPVLAALAAVAWLQTSHWRNSVTLWEHGVACQETNDFAQNSYAEALDAAGQPDKAMEHFATAMAINPLYLKPRQNIAGNLYKQGRSAEALTVCNDALQVDPNNIQTHFLKAVALFGVNQPGKSIDEFRFVIEMDPKHEQAHSNLAEVLRVSGRYGEAMSECRAALKLNPERPEAHHTMANLLWLKNDLEGAISECRTALELNSRFPQAHRTMANLFLAKNDLDGAIEHLQSALQLKPDDPTVQADLQKLRNLRKANQKPAAPLPAP